MKKEIDKDKYYVYKAAADRVKKASFTIETSVVMSVVFFVIFACIHLCFYVHNRSWLTSAAYEAALTGSMEIMKENGEVYDKALEKGKALGNTGFWGAENLNLMVNTGKEVSVTYNFDAIDGFYGLEWNAGVNGTSKIVDPVKRIRQIKAAAEIIDMITGE